MFIQDYTFRAATPVWEVGTAYTQNRTVCFTADVPASEEPVILAAAASCAFVLMVNGVYVAHGPARCAHGHFRVDEYDLSGYLTKAVNRVAIRVASYNRYSYSYLNQPGFLCAEITRGGELLAATGGEGFTAYHVAERLSKVPTYSFQRTFVEVYRLGEGAFDYEVNPNTTATPVAVEPAKAGRFIDRQIPYGDDEDDYPVSVIHRGSLTYDRHGDNPDSDLDFDSNFAVRCWDFSNRRDTEESPAVIDLPKNSFADVAFDRNTTGIFEFELECAEAGELYILFAEVLRDGDVYLGSLPSACNVLSVVAAAGKHHVRCAMPHTMKFARILAGGSAMTVRDLRLHHVAYPMSAIKTRFAGEDEDVKRIYDAAIETFRANAVDIYMDCPSRERAGWLCDSFCTSRVERVLTGDSLLERAFLQNFLLPDHFECLPKGMLPMCYPSDHPNGNFIPNWAMFYGAELYEYFLRTGDREFIDNAKERMYDLLAYFKPFENEYGLLEKLERWVFVEWSKSNDLVQDVSFPSNMMYAMMKDALARLYGMDELAREAAELREAIRRLSYTKSGFFCDNMVYRDGELVLSGEYTEACQYYAFFSGVATPASYPALWIRLRDEFGFDRRNTGAYPEVAPANAFIGNYLRMELLMRAGEVDKTMSDILDYFTYMANKTGTLWEHVSTQASCNHGFASHILVWMENAGYIVRDEE